MLILGQIHILESKYPNKIHSLLIYYLKIKDVNKFLKINALVTTEMGGEFL